jgi:hypothetical protein
MSGWELGRDAGTGRGETQLAVCSAAAEAFARLEGLVATRG